VEPAIEVGALQVVIPFITLPHPAKDLQIAICCGALRHKADMPLTPVNVRFWAQSGH
jgi:hypothetical protein